MSRAVMQQALDALEMYLNMETMDESYLLEIDLAPKAITAIREALAEQPAQQDRMNNELAMREPSAIRDRLIQAGWTPPTQQSAQGCEFCSHPLYAGTKCKNCGREQPAIKQDLTPEQPAQTDWEAVAADQAMTIALLKAELQDFENKEADDLEIVLTELGWIWDGDQWQRPTQKWMGLTDEETKVCFDSVPTQTCQSYEHWRSLVAKALEDKLCQKNT